MATNGRGMTTITNVLTYSSKIGRVSPSWIKSNARAYQKAGHKEDFIRDMTNLGIEPEVCEYFWENIKHC